MIFQIKQSRIAVRGLTPNSANGRSKTTLTLLFFFVFSFSVFAQKSIKFSGSVVDGKSRSALVGASVKLLSSSKVILTDVEGKFFLELKEGAKYEFEISYSGFAKKIIGEINPEIDNGLVISLEPNTKSLDEVVVRSTGRKESVASLYTAQRNSSSIQDGISSEAIRKTPDKNTGEVIKRVSGASVQDNKFVIIRGLNERYNVAMLNNNILPSTEPDKKAFSFENLKDLLNKL